jgi:hypothetical protein
MTRDEHTLLLDAVDALSAIEKMLRILVSRATPGPDPELVKKIAGFLGKDPADVAAEWGTEAGDGDEELDEDLGDETVH